MPRRKKIAHETNVYHVEFKQSQTSEIEAALDNSKVHEMAATLSSILNSSVAGDVIVIVITPD